MKSAQVRNAFVAFAETVRKLDATRIIFSWNSIPTVSAWHNVHDRTWHADSEAQFAEMLLHDNPDLLNAITIHLYHDSQNTYPGGTHSIDAAIALAAQIAERIHKPLFLGEFGAERQLGPRAQQQAVFEEFLNAIAQHRVPLAAVWVFDLPSQQGDWNISFDNDRAWMLDLVARANARVR
jgi:hypothetical protein